MDADGRIIPIVEGDQGEGFKDEIDPENIDPFTKALGELTEEKLAVLKDIPKKQGLFKELADEELTNPAVKPQPKRLKMELGMPITFHGYQYKVVKVLNRGRIMLKLMGEIPEGR